MLQASAPASPSKLNWRLALVIIALQLVFAAVLFWVNARTEDIPGRRVSDVLVAESPVSGYRHLADDAFVPAEIPREECCETTGVIYRTHLSAAEASLTRPAVLIVSAHDNAQIFVDGVHVGGLGRVDGPPPVMGRRPQLLPIPVALAHPGAEVDVLVQRAVGFGHLRPFHIGEYDALYPSYLMLRLLRSDLPFANAVIGLFVAAFCFCAAPLFGARGLLFSLGGLAVAWAGQHIGLLLTEPPWGANVSNGIYFVAFLATLVFTAWFFVEWTSVFAASRAPRFWPLRILFDPWPAKWRRWMGIACLILIAGSAAVIAWRLSFDSMIGAQDINRIIGRAGLVIMALCIVRIVSFYMRTGFREPIETSAFVFVLAAAIADIVMVQFFSVYGVFLGAAVTFFPLALLISLAARARGVFEAATATAERLNALVTEREQEILRTVEEGRRHEHAAMLHEERSRIMRDMHDGIGGQLLGLILQARSRRLTDDALVSGLQQSLDDLRMMVDSLEQGEGSLTGALGAFRARIEPRCEAAHVALGWEIEDVGATPNIGPDKTLQIYRILLEACTNALRHGSPTRISVSMRRTPDGVVTIQLADNGRGLGDAPRAGRGLANIRTRAQQIGAEVDIHSSAHGVQVTLALPA